MHSPPSERIQFLVSSLAIDEIHAAHLIELLDYVSDPDGDPIRHSVGLKAVSLAYNSTPHFQEHRDEFRSGLGAVSAGIIG